jgi:hypothetical protein
MSRSNEIVPFVVRSAHGNQMFRPPARHEPAIGDVKRASIVPRRFVGAVIPVNIFCMGKSRCNREEDWRHSFPIFDLLQWENFFE